MALGYGLSCVCSLCCIMCLQSGSLHPRKPLNHWPMLGTCCPACRTFPLSCRSLQTKGRAHGRNAALLGPITEGPSFVEETFGASDLSSSNNGLERSPTRANSRGLVRAGICLGLGQRNDMPSQSLGDHPVHISPVPPAPFDFRGAVNHRTSLLSRAVARPRCYRQLGRLMPLPLRGSG